MKASVRLLMVGLIVLMAVGSVSAVRYGCGSCQGFVCPALVAGTNVFPSGLHIVAEYRNDMNCYTQCLCPAGTQYATVIGSMLMRDGADGFTLYNKSYGTLFSTTGGYTIKLNATDAFSMRASSSSGSWCGQRGVYWGINITQIKCVPASSYIAPNLPDYGSVGASIWPGAVAGTNDTLAGFCNMSSAPYASFNYRWFINDAQASYYNGTAFAPGTIVAGDRYMCGIRQNDSYVMCWGRNGEGQLGVGDYVQRDFPVKTVDNIKYLKIAAFRATTCGIRLNDSKMMCWGYNYYGNVGNNRTGSSNNPSPNRSVDVLLGFKYTDVAAGSNHFCAIRKNDSLVVCWGAGTSGQLGNWFGVNTGFPVRTTDKSPYRSIYAGSDSSCGIRANDSRALCWGNNNYGSLGIGSSSSVGRPILVASTDRYRSIAVAGGTIVAIRANDSRGISFGGYNYYNAGCLGSTSPSQFSSPRRMNGNFTLRQISIDSNSKVWALLTNGTVVVCGYNVGGTLTSPDLKMTFDYISPGYNHRCAIGSDRKMYCWGSCGEGQCGTGGIMDTNVPSSLFWAYTDYSFFPGAYKNVNVMTNAVHPYSTTTGDNFILSCQPVHSPPGVWTNSSVTGIVSYTTTTVTTTTTVATTSTLVAMSYPKALAIDNATLIGYANLTFPNSRAVSYQWLKNGALNKSGVSLNIRSYHANGGTTCAIRVNDSKLMCWGFNTYGQACLGDKTNRNQPTQSSNYSYRFSEAAPADYHMCVLNKDNHRAMCCGLGSTGALGAGITMNSTVPIYVDSDYTFRSLSSGFSFTCGLRLNDSKVACWGRNTNGQIGDNTTNTAWRPEPVKTRFRFVDIVAGYQHMCGIREPDGRVACWGDNGNGRLGDNTTTQRLIPTLTYDTVAYKQVSAGYQFTCGIRANDSRVLCWGRPNEGQLGNGRPTIQRAYPYPINTTDKFKMIAVGWYHGCGVRISDGRVVCWGYNNGGQIGDNTTVQKNNPVLIADTRGYSSIVAGNTWTCGIRSGDGKMYCWGSNNYGQLGNQGTNQKNTPYPVYGTDNFYPGFGTQAPVDVLDNRMTTIGDNWTLSVSAVNGTASSGWSNTSTLIVSETTTTTLPPRINSVTVSSNYVYQGKKVNVTVNVQKTTNNLSKVWIYRNSSGLWNITSAVNGNNVISLNTTTLMGNYSLVEYVNDSKNNINTTARGWINFYTTTTTLPPTIQSFNISSKVKDTATVVGAAYIRKGTNNLSKVWIVVGGVVKNVTSAVNRTNNITFVASGLKNNYTVRLFTNDSKGNSVGSDITWTWVYVTSKITGVKLNQTQVLTGYHPNVQINLSNGTWGLSKVWIYRNDSTVWNRTNALRGANNLLLNTVLPLNNYTFKIRMNDTRNNIINATDEWYVSIASTTTTTTLPPFVFPIVRPSTVSTDNQGIVGYCNASSVIGNGTVYFRYKWLKNTVENSTGTAFNTRGLASGGNHTCVIDSNNTVECWGKNANGQVGVTGFSDRPLPVLVIGNINFAKISAGKDHICGIRANDSKVMCWGDGTNGQIGSGVLNSSWKPESIRSNDTFIDISSGYYHTCGVRFNDSRVVCWGLNTYGQAGGNSTRNLAPKVVDTSVRFVMVSAGALHTCGISTDGWAFCWGNASNGRLGIMRNYNYRSPIPVNTSYDFESLSAGGSHTCAVRAYDHHVFCWGLGNTGQLGNKTYSSHSLPVEVYGNYTFRQVTAGDEFTCGILDNVGQVYCWGRGDSGQIDNSTFTNRSFPRHISSAAAFRTISAGYNHVCGIKSTDNGLLCWGSGERGKLGIGNYSNTSVPIQPAINSTFYYQFNLNKLESISVLSGDRTTLGDVWTFGCSAVNMSGITAYRFSTNVTVGGVATTSTTLPPIPTTTLPPSCQGLCGLNVSYSGGSCVTDEEGCGLIYGVPLSDGDPYCNGDRPMCCCVPTTTTTSTTTTTTSSTTTTTIPGPTTTTTSSTTTTTTLPIKMVFIMPSDNAQIFVRQNSSMRVDARTTCGAASCKSVTMFMYALGLNITSPYYYNCPDILSGKTCNATYYMNVSGTQGDRYNVTGRVLADIGNYSAPGFVVYPTNTSGVVPLIEAKIVSPIFREYAFSNKLFNVTVNVTCRRGPCGNASVYLDPYFAGFSSNVSNVMSGSDVKFDADVQNDSMGLGQWWISLNGTNVSVQSVTNGSNSMVFASYGYGGNYTIYGYVNTSNGSFTNMSTPINVNFITTSTTTTTTSSTTTTSISITTTTVPPFTPKSGILPVGSGVPFYVKGTNPMICGPLEEGASCYVTFSVNATATQMGRDDRFFAIVNTTRGAHALSDAFYVFTIPSTPPIVANITFNRSLLCDVAYGDPDGDVVFMVNSSVKWFLNDSLLAVGTSHLNCSHGISCPHGMTLSCFACVVDEHGYDSVCAQSGGYYISNMPPILSPYITPFHPKDEDNLRCNENATDPEGDRLNFTYKWFRNNVSTTYYSQTLGANATQEEDHWLCQVTAFDGSNFVVVNTTSVFITGACASTPELLYPYNMSEVSSYPLIFNWTATFTSNVSRHVFYNFQVSDGRNFTYNFIDINPIPNYFISSESYNNSRYWWRVRSYSGGCYSNWSKEFTFYHMNGTCNDGTRNYHNGSMEEGVDCGGPCDACACAQIRRTEQTVLVQENATGIYKEVTLGLTDNSDYENHCKDGCFGPEFGESDVDCGGFGIWACPACAKGQNCTSDYECQGGLYCYRGAGGGVINKVGHCMSNRNIEACRNNMYNPTIGESDIDCGGPCDRCGVGKMCNGTMDCQDGLVCNQFDRCQVPTDEVQLKKGRQYGGIGLRGTGMNNAFCSGAGDKTYAPEKYAGLGGIIGCTDPMLNPETGTGLAESIGIYPPYTGLFYGRGMGTQHFAMDFSDFSSLWIGMGGENMDYGGYTPRVVYHIDLGFPKDGGFYWLPFWMASEGQEYKCISDTDCSDYGIFGVKDSNNKLVLGKCQMANFDISDITGSLKCSVFCSSAGKSVFDNLVDYWEGIRDFTKCPTECKHCTPYEGSVPFEGITGNLRGYPTIPQSECMYIPLCASGNGYTFKYRVSAKIYGVDAVGKQHELGRIDRVPYPACVATFTAGDYDKVTYFMPCTQASDLPGKTDQAFNADTACIQPLFWDIGRCDYEAITSKTEISVFDPETSYRRYYKETGCDYTEKVKNLWFIETSCAISPDVSDLIWRADLQRPLKEWGCADGNEPKDVLIDFTNVYNEVFGNSKCNGGEYYRAYDDMATPKKVLVMISRLAADNKECLVYDNLNSNAYRLWTDTSTYFDIYRGGDSVSQVRYGPRLRMPLCEGESYKIRLVYIEDALSQEADKSYSSANEYLWTMAKKDYLAGDSLIDLMEGSQFPSALKDFVNSYLPGEDFKCTPIFKRDGMCVEDIYYNNLLSSKSATVLFTDVFTVGKNSNDVSMTQPGTTVPYCYTDYYHQFKFNSKPVCDGKVKPSMYDLNTADATLRQPEKWLDTFYAMFSINLDLPPGMTFVSIINEYFENGIMRGLYSTMLVVLFYVSKFILWLLIYGLIVYLWQAMARRGVSIYVLLLAIFLILLILGKFGTYSNFMSFFR